MLLQPNLSNVLLLSVILAVMLWFNGVQVKHVLSAVAIGAIAVASLVALSVLGVGSIFAGVSPTYREFCCAETRMILMVIVTRRKRR